MSNATTFRKLTEIFDQDQFDKFVSKSIKRQQSYRAKGHPDFVGMTDAQMKAGAEFVARTNRAGFRYI